METVYRHADEVAGAEMAADRIIPIIMEVVGPIGSVVDVGGGTGAWLAAFRNRGVTRMTLVDHPSAGDELLIDRADFKPWDLAASMPALGRFDLAVCVECAEHLPAARSEELISCLTDASDAVVFSAAIPYQDGKGHINTQPADYWKELFSRRGFVRHDVLRGKIIQDGSIPWWYRQNLFLFARPGRLNEVPGDFLPEDFLLVHRLIHSKSENLGLGRLIGAIPKSIARSIRWRLLRK